MTKRRNFLKTALLVGMAPYVLPNTKTTASIQKPKRLKKGDRLGVIAPASNAWDNDAVRFAIEIVQSLGFEVVEGKNLYTRNGYLAGDDRERANEVNRMFADKTVDGIICLRGGYGCLRILPFLDYPTIAKNPKVLLGYSDITALLQAIHLKTGLVTFHGPIAKQIFSDYTLASFKNILVNGINPCLLGEAPPFTPAEGVVEKENRIIKIAAGKATGRLMGGNLSILTRMLGTAYEPEFKDRILVLEDVNEKPYHIDGMLTHLWLAGKLEQLAGVAIGKFTDCEPGEPPTRRLEDIFYERLAHLGIPVVRGLMFGHIKDQATFPIGAKAALDGDRGTLTLLESGVS